MSVSLTYSRNQKLDAPQQLGCSAKPQLEILREAEVMHYYHAFNTSPSHVHSFLPYPALLMTSRCALQVCLQIKDNILQNLQSRINKVLSYLISSQRHGCLCLMIFYFIFV